MKKTVSFALAMALMLSTLSLFSCKNASSKLKMNDEYTVVTGKDIYLTDNAAADTLSAAL